MGKQLDRDVLIDHLRRMMEARLIDRLPRSGYAKAIEDVAGCPTAEPKRGRWIPHYDWYPWFECSKCGSSCEKRTPYCPYCRAKMYEEDGEDDA